ncbi:MAG: hypothetical protein AAF585_10470 [Verrucomicrobiota bacterium]
MTYASIFIVSLLTTVLGRSSTAIKPEVYFTSRRTRVRRSALTNLPTS